VDAKARCLADAKSARSHVTYSNAVSACGAGRAPRRCGSGRHLCSLTSSPP
jgi:hypothetical protein